VLAAVGRDDAIFAVTAAGIAAEVDERHVVRRLVDAPRCVGPENSRSLGQSGCSVAACLVPEASARILHKVIEKRADVVLEVLDDAA